MARHWVETALRPATLEEARRRMPGSVSSTSGKAVKGTPPVTAVSTVVVRVVGPGPAAVVVVTTV